MDDHLVDGRRAARGEVVRVGRGPEGGRVVGAPDARVRGGEAVLVRGDRAARHRDALAVRGDGVESVGQERVDRVGVEGGGRPVGAAVPGDDRVPGAEVAAVPGVETQLVRVPPQDGRAAQDVGRGVGAELGRRLPGEAGGLLQGPVGGVADQVHDAEAVRLAGAPGVAVEPGLAVTDGGEQIAGYVVRLGGPLERPVHGAPGVRRGEGRGAGRGQDGGGEGREHGGAGLGVGGGACGHTCSCSWWEENGAGPGQLGPGAAKPAQAIDPPRA